MVTNDPAQRKNSRNIMVHRRNRVVLVTGCPRESPWCDALQAQPDRPGPGARDRLRDEAQAAQAILDPGVLSHRRLTQADPAHVLDETAVDVRKSLEIALRMPGWQSSDGSGRWARVALPCP